MPQHAPPTLALHMPATDVATCLLARLARHHPDTAWTVTVDDVKASVPTVRVTYTDGPAATTILALTDGYTVAHSRATDLPLPTIAWGCHQHPWRTAAVLGVAHQSPCCPAAVRVRASCRTQVDRHITAGFIRTLLVLACDTLGVPVPGPDTPVPPDVITELDRLVMNNDGPATTHPPTRHRSPRMNTHACTTTVITGDQPARTFTTTGMDADDVIADAITAATYGGPLRGCPAELPVVGAWAFTTTDSRPATPSPDDPATVTAVFTLGVIGRADTTVEVDLTHAQLRALVDARPWVWADTPTGTLLHHQPDNPAAAWATFVHASRRTATAVRMDTLRSVALPPGTTLPPSLISADTIVAMLRRSARDRVEVLAAIGLLAEHGVWLRKLDFVGYLIAHRNGEAHVRWQRARDLLHTGALDDSSATDRAVLDLAIDIATDRYHLTRLDPAHHAAVRRAISAVCPD